MLKKLRNHLTILYAAMTGAVLIGMAVFALQIAESQLMKSVQTAFQSNINTIVHKLQTDVTIGTSWLAKTETSDGLVIHIEDGGKPLSFAGAWKPETERNLLIELAQKKAMLNGINPKLPPVSGLETTSVTFELKGQSKERYLAAVVQIPVDRSWLSLTLLKDMSQEDATILTQRLLFAGLAILGTGILFLLGRLFAGRAIKPVEQSQREQTQFVAAASHELRSPLAVIRASSAAAKADEKQAEHFLNQIDQECERLTHLVNDLLLLAQSDTDHWTVQFDTVELDTLLIESYERFCALAVESGHTLELILPEESSIRLHGDANRLQQALAVLLDNALSYTPQGCKIILSGALSSNGKMVKIKVEDNGPGIGEEEKQRVFDRFYRADASRSVKNHFGLGLSIAKQLIHLHRGKLFLQETVQHGCTFVMELPVKETGKE